MALHRLLFDSANPTESANVGAHLIANGTQLTATGTALDVAATFAPGAEIGITDGTDSLAINGDGSINAVVSATDLDIRDLAFATDSVDVSGSSVTVSATDLDIRDLTHVSDSIKVGDGTDFLAVNADGSLNITDNGGSLTVDAVDLDIRNLVFADDKVDVSNSTNVAVVDGGGSLTVDAVDLDIRDLSSASDSVAAWVSDGSGNAISSTAGALNVHLASPVEINTDDDALADVAIASSSESSTTTSGALITSTLADRKYVWLYNNGNKEVYVGPSGVTTGTGFPLFPGSILEARIGASVAIHSVAQSGTQDVRVLQAS